VYLIQACKRDQVVENGAWKRFPLKELDNLETWYTGIADRNDNRENFKSHLPLLIFTSLGNLADSPRTGSNGSHLPDFRPSSSSDALVPDLSQQGQESLSTREMPKASNVAQSFSFPTRETLVKLAQLTREMNHIYL
jgi:hypothetical protein